MLLITFFIFGLIVGSFLNVVIIRLETAETLLGRSFCRHCKRQIAWYDNIPLLSFVLLRGECRGCETKISWQYPIVEFLTGVTFLLIASLFIVPGSLASYYETVWLIGLVSALIVIGAYDFRTMEIPVSALYFAALWTGWWLVVLEGDLVWMDFFASRLGEGFIGAVLIGGLFFALVFFSKETWMGWGDVWLGAVAGLVVGWKLALPFLTLSFGAGALFGLLLLLKHKKHLKSPIPFGPFLCLGTIGILILEKTIPNFHAYFLF